MELTTKLPEGSAATGREAQARGIQPKVFAVIINWNGDRDTIVCLKSLLSLAYGNFHVIISDNGSRADSLDAIRRWLAESVDSAKSYGIRSYAILENGRNLGFTGANTTGINYALARGADYVLFLNNDTIVTPDFLQKMILASEGSSKIGITGCKIFYADSDPNGKHKIWSLGGYTSVFGMPVNIAGGKYDRPEWNDTREQPLINGCCMLIKRAVIESIGVQSDELFFGMDDVEYSLRASRYGWTNIVAADAVIYHAGSQSVSSRPALQIYYLFRNVLLFRSRAFAFHQNLWFFSAFTIRYVALASLYRWIAGRGKVNRGVFYALKDFFAGRTGECPHLTALRG